ncbi:MAG: universal stress protein [Alphaproteobacteria bacterium]|uniref:Universal stress protein n=1 Tax=Candidatus Nitrobium versatile TaxID=2884831 RepID=A0A953JAM4_9BACT|nr:universal stress protein [Candidatus Nitrobium versatile]
MCTENDRAGEMPDQSGTASAAAAEQAVYKTILVAFDGSEFSRSALREASLRTRRYGGKVIMVHAVYFDEEEFGAAPEQLEKRFDLGRKICFQAKEEVSSEYGIAVESVICQGDPPEVITAMARERGADLIALGTHGRKGLRRMLMGSVTSQVVLDAPCDVMVVRKPCSDCTGSYESVLVPFDGSASSRRALQRACSLAKSDGADITVLYVIPRYEEMVEFLRTGSIRKSLHGEAERIIGEARNEALSSGISAASLVREGAAPESIVEVARMLESQLIVMGSHGWKGVERAIMGSTAERVITNAPCPVLVVK